MSELVVIVVVLSAATASWYHGRVIGYHDGWMDAFRRLK